MADPNEMALWRARRMAELQAEAAGLRGQSAEEAEKAQQKQKALEEERRLVLKRVLTPGASERLANIALVKPEKARSIENYIIQTSQSGRLGGKVTEEQLKELLKQFSAQNEKTTKITIQRRRSLLDDDW